MLNIPNVTGDYPRRSLWIGQRVKWGCFAN
jgi:hypothetical protein